MVLADMCVSSRRGFSLIELMIVIAIIGILVAVALPHFTSMTSDAKRTKAKSDVMEIAKAIAKFNSFEGSLCEDISELKGKYISNIEDLRDPWGHRYCYDYDYGIVYSKGPDGRHTREKGKTWNDDIIVDVYESLCLTQVSLEKDPDPNTDDNSRYDRLYLMFNKAVIINQDTIDLSSETAASKDLHQYPKGIDEDARDGYIFRWYEGPKPIFKPEYSPFPDDATVYVRRTDDPREVVLVFPPGMHDVFQTTTYLNLTGTKKDPNPLFRAMDETKGAVATGSPLKIGAYDGPGIEVDEEISRMVDEVKGVDNSYSTPPPELAGSSRDSSISSDSK
jgi:prepilin-type N-terminal cleavage/methylation domain-containing protein